MKNMVALVRVSRFHLEIHGCTVHRTHVSVDDRGDTVTKSISTQEPKTTSKLSSEW